MLMKNNKLFARIKRFAKSRESRRGVAIELAIMVIVITLALSILLTSISIIQTSNKNTRKKELAFQIELDQIGDEFFAEVKKGNTNFSNIFTESKYDCSVSDDGLILTVKEKTGDTEDQGKTLLTVELKKDENGTVTVKKWAYN